MAKSVKRAELARKAAFGRADLLNHLGARGRRAQQAKQQYEDRRAHHGPFASYLIKSIVRVATNEPARIRRTYTPLASGPLASLRPSHTTA